MQTFVPFPDFERSAAVLDDRRLGKQPVEALQVVAIQQDADLPTWWGDDAVHRSHRSSLLRKDPEHDRPRFEPGLPDDLEYVWPVGVTPEAK